MDAFASPAGVAGAVPAGAEQVASAASSASALGLGNADWALLSAAQAKNRAAFAELIETHQSGVFAYLRARLLDRADAEDLCQEVFVRCYTARAAPDRHFALRPWLLGIARNVLHEHVRKLKRRRELPWTELCLELDERASPRADQQTHALGHLQTCLESLGPSAREALELRYRAAHGVAHIAKLLRRSEGAVKVLMHRARQALKHCVAGKLNAS